MSTTPIFTPIMSQIAHRALSEALAHRKVAFNAALKAGQPTDDQQCFTKPMVYRLVPEELEFDNPSETIDCVLRTPAPQRIVDAFYDNFMRPMAMQIMHNSLKDPTDTLAVFLVHEAWRASLPAGEVPDGKTQPRHMDNRVTVVQVLIHTALGSDVLAQDIDDESNPVGQPRFMVGDEGAMLRGRMVDAPAHDGDCNCGHTH